MQFRFCRPAALAPVLALAFGFAVALLLPAKAGADETIRIVGSSTVYPFVTALSERFGAMGDFPTPVVQATGTGAGLQIFCRQKGRAAPQIAGASRQIKPSELALCEENGITAYELPLGYDGIVLASANGGIFMPLETRQLFAALAARLPVNGTLQPNPNRLWSDIDPALPQEPIVVIGPPPTSGTRDAFASLLMEKGCAALADAATYGLTGRACHALREDGAYIEAGENDNLIIQRLVENPRAIGVFGFSFLQNSRHLISALPIDGVLPEMATISDGQYAGSRRIYIYARGQSHDDKPAVQAFFRGAMSDAASGEGGYLTARGLVPLPMGERRVSPLSGGGS